MDSKDGIREFLASRRAKLTPEQAGLPVYGTNRCVTDAGQRLNIYTAEPGSPSHDALNLLASWITTTSHAALGMEEIWTDSP